MPPIDEPERFVAEYRDYLLKVFGRGDEWKYWITEGKWNLVQDVEVKGSRQVAQNAAGENLVSFLSKTEQRRYKVDYLQWRDWLQETRHWLASQRSNNS